MSATIRDLSSKSGLPISVVSKVLNRHPDIDEEVRRRVLDAADEIGYFPAAIARKEKGKRSYSIGAILDDKQDYLLHNYFSVVLNGFKREAERHGYEITLINRRVNDRQQTYMEHFVHRNLDGACMMCVYFYDDELLELVRSGVPVVAIDHYYNGKDCVLSDNSSGMQEIVKYALSMGHTKIAFIHGTPSAVTDERVAAFREIMGAHGIQVPEAYLVPSSYHSTRHQFDAMRKLLALAERPSCVLTTDDYSALGAMDAIGQAGLKIPEDISLVGYDGISMIQKLRPRLTTYMQNAERIGQRAAERLIGRIENPDAPVEPPDVVTGVLIKGETVRRMG